MNQIKKMKMNHHLVFFLMWVTGAMGLSGCSIKSLAVDITADIFVAGSSAFEEEGDLELAEKATAGNLKVLEALLKSAPEHEDLLTLLAKSYGGYAYAFVEDRYDALKETNVRAAKFQKYRASNFYLRAKGYAMKVLKEESSDFKDALSQDFESFENSLDDFDEDDVAPLFWAAYNWGNWLNLNLQSPAAIAAAPRIERMMQKVLTFNETFFFGGPHLFYGVYYGGRPPMLGGNPKKAKAHFEKALSLMDRKFLITQVLYAQYYAAKTGNEVLFKKLLREVIRADANIFPEQKLITAVAKKKARRLLARVEDLF